MKVGLLDIEPKVFNAAYMQIATYHKLKGDSVEWWIPLADRQFNLIYCSSLFDFTDKFKVPERAICGGTGFDINSRLSLAIEKCELDYSIYPNCETSFVWFSRGCVRDCEFCCVMQKEGYIRPVRPKNLNPKGKYITVQDNNFFANPEWKRAIEKLKKWARPVDFQGIDIRTITDEQCRALAVLRHYKQLKFAWDRPADEIAVMAGIKRLTAYVKPWRCMCYVLIGFDSTEAEDLHRVQILKLAAIDPFVMPYDRSDLYQRAFARWVNRKELFKSVNWGDYRGRVERQEEAGTGWNEIGTG
jgi:hypothetical protein